VIANIKGHGTFSKRYQRDIRITIVINCNHFRESELSHTARGKMSRNSYPLYHLIKKSQLFIEDARIFYDVMQNGDEDNNRAV